MGAPAGVSSARARTLLSSAGPPALFVVLWSTGFTVAKESLEFAEPMTILTIRVDWTASLAGSLAWMVLVLSVGTVSLLLVLIRRGAAARTASLFYLVPPVTALLAYAWFGETLGPAALAGMAIAVLGVALVQRGEAGPAREPAAAIGRGVSGT